MYQHMIPIVMILGYKDKRTATVATGKIPKGFPANLQRRTIAMLRVMDAAAALDDLRSPPGNRLEKLAGNRKGQHSVRINDQFRICFIWTKQGPDEVEFTDYH